MKTYEITYLTTTEETADAGLVKPALNEVAAKIVSVHPWGARRKLAYPIKKQDQAFFTTVVFEAEPKAIAGIDRALRLNNAILRTLIVEFVPGMFHRTTTTSDEATTAKPVIDKTASQSEVAKEKEEEAVAAPIEETPPAEEIVTPEESVETVTKEAETPKPKTPRRRTKAAEAADAKTLDEKLDELLKEDITK